MARSNRETVRTGATVFIAGSAGTALAGALVQLVVQPSSNVPDGRWSYPWATGPFVAVSLLYIVFHLLVVVGLVSFGRSGVAGTTRAARSGVALAVAGTLVLAAGELASLPIRDALVDDTSAAGVGAVFGLGVVLSAIGLLLTGKATLSARIWHGWRRYTPLVAGIWTTVLVGVAATKALPGGVAIYGACLLAVAIALRTDPVPADSPGGEPQASPYLAAQEQ
jgi:hypothetical protein